MRRYTSFFALLGFAASAHAVVWNNGTTDAEVQAFGNTSLFVGVGKVVRGSGFGTGTYIGRGTDGSGWVLTANHVISTGQTGSFQLPNYGTFNLTDTYRLPGTDVAISRLVNFTASIFAPVLRTTALTANGTDFVSAGYGRARAESSSTYIDNYVRRGFRSRTAGIYNSTTSSTSTFPGPYVIDVFDAPTSSNFRPLEGFGAQGDSGSMVLTDEGIVGVLSYGDYESYGGENFYSQITPTLASTIYARTGITPVPEPATLAALGLGAAAMLRRRRRRA